MDNEGVPGLVASVEYDNSAHPAGEGEEPNLVASLAADGSGAHYPVLDIDHPCRLVETSPGKFHLYIDVAVGSEKYLDMLRAMSAAGVLEPGWVAAAEREGATLVRLRPQDKRREP